MPRPAARMPRGAIARRAPSDRSAPDHLRMIRQLPCAATGRTGQTEAHHLCEGMASEGRGMGAKAPDRWAIPLSADVHRRAHASGKPETFLLAFYGVRARELAEALWRCRGDLEAMRRVMDRGASWRANV